MIDKLNLLLESENQKYLENTKNSFGTLQKGTNLRVKFKLRAFLIPI